ncbi:MAG: low-complexity tail membrane protein [Cyanobacteria bacterium J06632_3]
MQQNRYLWVHIAGLAVVPLLLDGCLAGLASAGPALPYGGQFWAIALISIAPSLAMQWLKPFYIFSLPPLALKPDALSDNQRRCLQLFQSWQVKAIAGLTAGLSYWLLAQLYIMSPRMTPVFTPVGGLAIATLTFFIVCAILQISISSARVLLVSQRALQRVPAMETEKIRERFLILGFGLKQLLPSPAEVSSSAESSGSDKASRASDTASSANEISRSINISQTTGQTANEQSDPPEEASVASTTITSSPDTTGNSTEEDSTEENHSEGKNLTAENGAADDLAVENSQNQPLDRPADSL